MLFRSNLFKCGGRISIVWGEMAQFKAYPLILILLGALSVERAVETSCIDNKVLMRLIIIIKRVYDVFSF